MLHTRIIAWGAALCNLFVNYTKYRSVCRARISFAETSFPHETDASHGMLASGPHTRALAPSRVCRSSVLLAIESSGSRCDE